MKNIFFTIVFIALGITFILPSVVSAQVSGDADMVLGRADKTYQFQFNGYNVGSLSVDDEHESWSFTRKFLQDLSNHSVQKITVMPRLNEEQTWYNTSWISSQNFRLASTQTSLAHKSLVYAVDIPDSILDYYVAMDFSDVTPVFTWYIVQSNIQYCDDGHEGCAVDLSGGATLQKVHNTSRLKAVEMITI